jgi:hypothetical protein
MPRNGFCPIQAVRYLLAVIAFSSNPMVKTEYHFAGPRAAINHD